LPVFNLPKPLSPAGFDDRKLYRRQSHLTLYCALAATGEFRLFPKDPVNHARCDVPRFFAARYFTDDEETAVSEFEHRWRGMRHRIWRGVVELRQSLDLSNDEVIERLQLGPKFLMEDPYFPWHFITASGLTAGCDSVAYRSFRGPGRCYAVFELTEKSLQEPFRPI
jgi:hypothetical protein